jgi:hypothetical protein
MQMQVDLEFSTKSLTNNVVDVLFALTKSNVKYINVKSEWPMNILTISIFSPGVDISIHPIKLP